MPVKAPAGTSTAPLLSVRPTVTLAPAAAVKPVTPSPPWAAVRPSSCKTVTVNVCGWPTALTASGAMLTLASTKRLTAAPVSPDWPSPVARVSETPLTVNVAVALPVTMPALCEVKVTEK